MRAGGRSYERANTSLADPPPGVPQTVAAFARDQESVAVPSPSRVDVIRAGINRRAVAAIAGLHV